MTDEGEQEQDPGFVYLDWQPAEGAKDHSQRVEDVLEVEVRDPVDPEGYDQGELVLHTTEGLAVFDRNPMRGFRTRGNVAVPAYERADSASDSSDEGAEQ